MLRPARVCTSSRPGGVLEGVYPPGASTTDGSNYANKVEGGIYFQRQSGSRAIYHMEGARQMHLSDAHCAPQDQTSNLCGWGKASAMYNKSALHIGCKYTDCMCLGAEKESKEDYC